MFTPWTKANRHLRMKTHFELSADREEGMMEANQRRQSVRCESKAPIIVTDNTDGCYHGASVINISAEGMYFETNQAFTPDSDVWIKLVYSVPETHDINTYNEFHAHVKHCRSIKGNGHKYGIGVQYAEAMRMVRCDLCNCQIYFEQAHKADDMIYLCPDCCAQLENLPEDKVKSSIEDYLMCNII